MIATEPTRRPMLWDEIGWRERETLNDDRRFLIYAQRTADGRIALGGRGAPYHWGSQIDPVLRTPTRRPRRPAANAGRASFLLCTTWP